MTDGSTNGQAVTAPAFTGSSIDAVANALGTLLARFDGWQNVMTGLGVEGKDTRSAALPLMRELSPQSIEALYEHSGLFACMVDAVPAHGTRRWIRLTINKPDGTADEELVRKTMKRAKELHARFKLFDASRIARLRGGSVIVPLINDGRRPDQPLNILGVRAFTGLEVFSRDEIEPLADMDRTTRQYENPRQYRFVTGGPRDIIDASRLFRFRGIQTTEYRDTQRLGWGLPIAERVWDAVRMFENATEYHEAMFKDIVQGVLTVEGLADMLASDDGNETLIKRLRLMMLVASAFNAVLLDKDEKYERRTLNMSGASDAMRPLMVNASAQSRIPVSILFGQEAGGLSTKDSTGETMWNDNIAEWQENEPTDFLDWLFTLIFADQSGPTKGVIPESWSVEWLPLKEPTDKEEADTEHVRVQDDIALVSENIITPMEARSRMLNDPRCRYELDSSLDVGDKLMRELEPEPEPAPAPGAKPAPRAQP